METEDIKILEVPSNNNAALYLWATAPKLIDALEVMEAWGFTYRTHGIWDKVHIGMGYWFRGLHELLLVGRKGNFSPPPQGNREPSIHREKRKKHSAKPGYYYVMIEGAFPNCSKLELFAREKREGWDCWGNDVPSLTQRLL